MIVFQSKKINKFLWFKISKKYEKPQTMICSRRWHSRHVPTSTKNLWVSKVHAQKTEAKCQCNLDPSAYASDFSRKL